MNNTTTFYATDRDIFEALTSKRKKVTIELLHELCHDRGVILSLDEDREDIIEYISTLLHDYNDFDHIMKMIAVSGHSEKITCDDVPINLSNEKIKEAVDSITEKRKQHGEDFEVVVESENRTVIKVDYSEIDYSMTRLRQRTEKEAYIEVIRENGSTKIRRPANDKTNDILADLYSKLCETEESVKQKISVNLQGVVEPQKRTEFFTNLISKINGLTLADVTYIKVDKLAEMQIVDEEEYKEEKEMAAQEILGHVKKAALNGDGLLYSSEFQHLSRQGFFISKIIWQSIENIEEPLKIEFEAGFDNPIEGTEFRYNARFYLKQKDGVYTTTRRYFEDHEKSKYFKLIESTALSIMKEVSGSVGDGV